MPRGSDRIFCFHPAGEATRCSHDSSTSPGLGLISKEANVFSSSDRCITTIGCAVQHQSDPNWQRADPCLKQIEAVDYGLVALPCTASVYVRSDLHEPLNILTFLGSKPLKALCPQYTSEI